MTAALIVLSVCALIELARALHGAALIRARLAAFDRKYRESL